MLILAGSLLAASVWLQAQAGAPADVSQNAQQDSVAPTMSAKEAASRFGLTVTTSPDTVTVGEHFTVTVRVRVPAALKSAIEFPPDIDQAALNVTSSVGVGLRHDSIAGEFVEATQTYEVAAWDVGAAPIGLADLVVGGTHIPLTEQTIADRSLLPAGTVAKLRADPRAPRDPFSMTMTVGRMLRQIVQDHPVIAALVALMLVGLLVVAWMYWRRRRQANALIDWVKWTLREFQRIEAMGLLEKGLHEQHAILMTNVLRESLVHQFPTVRSSATTSELVDVLHRESLIPADRALQLFERVDLFKFARYKSELVEAKAIGSEDYAIVDEIEARRQAEIAALKAAKHAAAEKKIKGAA